MTTPATEAAPDAAALTPAAELGKLRLILGHVSKLSTASKRWLRDRLAAELAAEEDS